MLWVYGLRVVGGAPVRNVGDMEFLQAEDIEALARDVLIRAGTEPAAAISSAQMIRRAEERGLRRVALGILPHMIEHLRTGRVSTDAVPTLSQRAPSVFHCDADGGFSCPAIDFALPAVMDHAIEQGLASLTVCKAYPVATLAPLSDALSDRGLTVIARVGGIVSEPNPGGRLALTLGDVGYGLPSTGTESLPRPILMHAPDLDQQPYEGPFGGPFLLTHHLVILRTELWPADRSATGRVEKSGIAVPTRLLEKIITA